MEELILEIVEPTQCRSDIPIYFNGTNLLKINKNASERLHLSKEDEYLLFAKLGDMIFVSKKEQGDNKFGFHARNRNKSTKTWYVTNKDLSAKLGFTKGYYSVAESLEQAGRMWFKLIKR